MNSAKANIKTQEKSTPISHDRPSYQIKQNSYVKHEFGNSEGDSGSQEHLPKYGIKFRSKKENKKSVENCRRSARIVLLYQLSEQLSSDQYCLKKLNGILSLYNNQFKGSAQLQGKSRNIKYFNSPNFGRIKICQNQFIKKIILNPNFQNHLLVILDNIDLLVNTNLIRKNKRGVLTLEERKIIIRRAFEEYRHLLIDNIEDQQSQIKEEGQHEGENPQEPSQAQNKGISIHKMDDPVHLEMKFPYMYGMNLHQNPSCISNESEYLRWWHFWTCQTEFSRNFGPL